MDAETLLSKWWQTDSCKRAFAQAEEKRKARLELVRAEVAERKAKLDAECQALFESEHEPMHFECLNGFDTSIV